MRVQPLLCTLSHADADVHTADASAANMLQLIGRPETLGYKLCNLLSINFDMDIRDNDGMSCFSQASTLL